jgi:hypothetical protein
MIFAEIFPLHAVGSQILPLHFAAGSQILSLHYAAGSQILPLQYAAESERENIPGNISPQHNAAVRFHSALHAAGSQFGSGSQL